MKKERNSMNNLDLDFEEWCKSLEELWEAEGGDSDVKYAGSDNCCGAGRYGFIRSSENWEALIRGKEAEFRPEADRWYEHIYCGYASWRDGDADLEWVGMSRDQFKKEHPLIRYREAFYDFQYGKTRTQVAFASFWLKEYEGPKYRKFDFNLKDITMQQMEEYLTALESWSLSGELNVGPYSGIPAYKAWKSE